MSAGEALRDATIKSLDEVVGITDSASSAPPDSPIVDPLRVAWLTRRNVRSCAALVQWYRARPAFKVFFIKLNAMTLKSYGTSIEHYRAVTSSEPSDLDTISIKLRGRAIGKFERLPPPGTVAEQREQEAKCAGELYGGLVRNFLIVVARVFRNALLFNPPGHHIHKVALRATKRLINEQIPKLRLSVCHSVRSPGSGDGAPPIVACAKCMRRVPTVGIAEAKSPSSIAVGTAAESETPPQEARLWVQCAGCGFYFHRGCTHLGQRRSEFVCLECKEREYEQAKEEEEAAEDVVTRSGLGRAKRPAADMGYRRSKRRRAGQDSQAVVPPIAEVKRLISNMDNFLKTCNGNRRRKSGAERRPDVESLERENAHLRARLDKLMRDKQILEVQCREQMYHLEGIQNQWHHQASQVQQYPPPMEYPYMGAPSAHVVGAPPVGLPQHVGPQYVGQVMPPQIPYAAGAAGGAEGYPLMPDTRSVPMTKQYHHEAPAAIPMQTSQQQWMQGRGPSNGTPDGELQGAAARGKPQQQPSVPTNAAPSGSTNLTAPPGAMAALPPHPPPNAEGERARVQLGVVPPLATTAMSAKSSL